MFVRIISGFVALGAAGWAAMEFMAAGMSDGQDHTVDPLTLVGCGIVFAVGACGVIWGGR